MIVQISVREDDVVEFLRYKEKPQDWDRFIEFLETYLPEALQQHIEDEVKYLLNMYLDEVQGCPHRRTTVYTTGGYYYAAGQVWDDIKDHIICLDCGMVLSSEDEDADAEEVIF